MKINDLVTFKNGSEYNGLIIEKRALGKVVDILKTPTLNLFQIFIHFPLGNEIFLPIQTLIISNEIDNFYEDETLKIIPG
jgi:hypothetical protein